MANYAASALLTAQTKIAGKYNEAELRRKRRPVIQLALQNQQYSIPDAPALRKSEARPVEVHYKLAKAAGSSVVKSTRHTGGKGDSSKLTLSWSRFTETFSFSHKLMYDKVFGAQEVFNHEIEQAIQNLHDRIENAAMAYAVSARCQLAAAGISTSGMGTWTDGAGTFYLSIASANKDWYAQNSKAFMYGRHYRGAHDVVCDLVLFNQLERTMNQGGGNSTNTGFQFGGVNFIPTTDTILAGVTTGSGLWMPQGSIACMPWNDKLNKDGYGRPDDYIGMFTTLDDPYGLDLKYDVSVWSDRADSASIGGHVQDIKDEYEISCSIGFAVSPLSTAGDSTIHLIVQG